MFNKKNPMRYFSGSTFARLPLYKLAAGGTAVVLTASIGLGAFAARVGPLSAPAPRPPPLVPAPPPPAAPPPPLRFWGLFYSLIPFPALVYTDPTACSF